MTKDARRSSGSGSAVMRRKLGTLAVSLLLICAALTPGLAQQVEDITSDIEKYRGILALANQRLDDLDLPEALARFTEVIDAYKTGKLPPGTPLTRQIVGGAFEGRARTYANLGRMADAEADFESLLRYEVSWPIDRTRTSPKIVTLFDEVRRRLVGTVTIKTEPPGAAVELNGTPIGRTPIFDRETPAGPYTILIKSDGHEPAREQITVQGGTALEKVIRLSPNARNILVSTSPVGATVSINGQPRGTTFGSAGPEYAEAAQNMGLTMADLSLPLLVEHLKPGDYLLKVEKECHEPQVLSISVSLDPDDPSPMRFEPIRLTPSLGSLSIESVPEGAEAYLDGQPIGRTPLRVPEVCSGRHDLVLKRDGVGQWIGRVGVDRGRRTTLTPRLRMTLAYVGMLAPSQGEEPPAGERELAGALARLESYNLLAPGAGLPEVWIARNRPDQVDGLTPEFVAGVAAATGADLVVAAEPGEGAFRRTAELSLHSPAWPSLRETISIPLDDDAEAEKIIARIGETTPLERPWLGAVTIETRRTRNPIVIRVEPGGPAATSGVRVGDAVVSLGGQGVVTPAQIDLVISDLRPGSQASLTVQSPGAPPRTVNVVIGTTPVLAGTDAASGPSARLAAEMAFRARMESALGRAPGLERGTALLSLALALMRAGQPEAALRDALSKVELPEGPGISAGTAAYLRGLCFQAIKRPLEARKQLELAAGQSGATLWTRDGPPVAERARRLLGTL